MTFYWHDYETWGSDPRRDRPCQFAGLRTDADLNPVGDPLVLFCRPADDYLPDPGACLITGISPQLAWEKGLPEAQFAMRIESELSLPGTCGVGYNSRRFDDEVTRNLFYRNFIDPYAREWRNGNSRWDLIDVMRLAHALRPEGIQWPVTAEGTPSFRLEDLTAANGIAHAQAHDALADVRATIDLARVLKSRQPRLFAYAFTLRSKETVEELVYKGPPFLHVSSRYPAKLGCIAPVLPIARHPDNPKGVICFDLRHDPEPLLALSPEAIHRRLFTRNQDLPDGEERIPLKTLHLNQVPMVAPMGTLTREAAERWDIDLAQVERHAQRLVADPDLMDKVRRVHQMGQKPVETDPDFMIYAGGFFSDADRRVMEGLRKQTPETLSRSRIVFQDPRGETLLFRYRARNWPETLTEEEREEWDSWRFERLTDPEAGGGITVDEYLIRIQQLRPEHASVPRRLELLDQLADWADRIMDAAP